MEKKFGINMIFSTHDTVYSLRKRKYFEIFKMKSTMYLNLMKFDHNSNHFE